MHTMKVTQIGNSVGVILPKELVAKLGLAKGDTVYAIEQPRWCAADHGRS
jgi:putative addiction module antidote